MKSNSNTSLSWIVLALYLKTSHQSQGQLDFFPILSSRSFVFLHLTFRSVINFELIFVKGIRSGFLVFVFAFGCSVVTASFVENTTISPLICLPLLLKISCLNESV